LILLCAFLFSTGHAEERVGRLLMLAYRGSAVPLEQLRAIKPGGFIFFAGNLPSTEVARATTRALQDAADYPLLLAIDQEGGPFTSYRADDATIFPGNMALGAAGDVKLAREVAEASGLELAYAGFNMSFGPVVDVNINPDNPIIGIRSFGADPAQVSAFGVAYLEGLEAAGVAAVAKHFPGHGDTAVDSHLALPSVEGERARLEAVELPPFRAMIEAGVPAIMTAHVAFPIFEEGVPATLSKQVLSGLLREELGFDGLVVTDYMDMKAIADHYGPGEAAVRSVLAGADMVLLGPDAEVQREVHAALREAVRSGRLSEERIDEAVSRIEEVAARYRSGWDRPRPDYAEHRALARWAAERGATLLWNEDILPLAPDAEVVVVAPRPSLFGEPPHLGEVLKRHHAHVTSIAVGERPTDAQIAEATAAAAGAEVIVFGSYFWMGGYPAELQALGEALAATGKPLVLVSLGNPDDLRFLPSLPQAYLAVYGYREANLEAASSLLTGRVTPQGRLPVAAGRYPLGSGMDGF
jgi:beta-N-acetylhexosaminidase